MRDGMADDEAAWGHHTIPSGNETALRAQGSEHGQKRQAENGEMVTVDALEQMHAESFELIGTDTGRDRLPRLIQIAFNLAVGERPHRHSGDTDVAKHYLAVARHRNGGMQLVGLAGKLAQLISGLRAAGLLNSRFPRASV